MPHSPLPRQHPAPLPGPFQHTLIPDWAHTLTSHWIQIDISLNSNWTQCDFSRAPWTQQGPHRIHLELHRLSIELTLNSAGAIEPCWAPSGSHWTLRGVGGGPSTQTELRLNSSAGNRTQQNMNSRCTKVDIRMKEWINLPGVEIKTTTDWEHLLRWYIYIYI